jgi:hypothetical protein
VIQAVLGRHWTNMGWSWCDCESNQQAVSCTHWPQLKGHNLDGYIYLLGVLGCHTPGYNYSDVFVARVAPGSTGTLSAYQYWNGTAYTSKRLTYPNFNGYAPAAVMQGTPQGSIVYNSYYNLYIYLSPGAALSGRKQPSKITTWRSGHSIFT